MLSIHIAFIFAAAVALAAGRYGRLRFLRDAAGQDAADYFGFYA